MVLYTSSMHMNRKSLNGSFLIIALAMIGWFLLYKVTSSDFWWHVKAGQILRTTGWIATDPFAHTREGLPYLASQSWLAQIVLSVFYDIGGAGGIFFLRFILISLTFGVLLLIDKRSIWPNVFAVLLGAILLRPFILDRPQLWTFLCFSLQLFLTVQFILSPNLKDKSRTKILFSYLVPLWAVQVLWVNMHGAAALVTVALIGAALLESVMQKRYSVLPILLVGIVGTLVALIVSPNGISNFVYVQNLFADQTKQFILEWQAPVLSGYLQITGVFWVMAVASLLWSRKHIISFGTILLAFGIFASTAMRHLPLFVLAALAITIASLKNNLAWQTLITEAINRKILTLAISIGMLAALLGFNRITMVHLIRSGGNTIGTLEQHASAYDFLEQAKPTGNMFNSFDVGAYFLYRGYPDRKVFVDGRNVDYGYDFLKKTTSAAQNPEVWQQLEDEYGLTYAVFNYTSKREITSKNIPYANHLEPDTEWALVYIDDQAAIYFKHTPKHKDVIEQYEYHFITPEKIERGTIFEGTAQKNVHALEAELLRMAQSNAKGVKALLLLAKLYHSSQLLDDALRILSEAIERKPMHYEAYEIAGQVYEKAGRYEEAVEMFTKSMEYSSHLDSSYDYERFAEIWEKAGYTKEAESFREKAIR